MKLSNDNINVPFAEFVSWKTNQRSHIDGRRRVNVLTSSYRYGAWEWRTREEFSLQMTEQEAKKLAPSFIQRKRP